MKIGRWRRAVLGNRASLCAACLVPAENSTGARRQGVGRLASPEFPCRRGSPHSQTASRYHSCCQHNKLSALSNAKSSISSSPRDSFPERGSGCQFRVRAQSQPLRWTAGEPAQTDVKASRGPADWAMVGARPRIPSDFSSASPAGMRAELSGRMAETRMELFTSR
jgi:hypothetical protein